jgi:hypothetical protein
VLTVYAAACYVSETDPGAVRWCHADYDRGFPNRAAVVIDGMDGCSTGAPADVWPDNS